MFDVDVLIAGAGPVGLALAVELGLRGVSCRVLERNDRVGYSPRAKTTNVRSREHLRRWGIADALRQASPMPPDYPPNVVFATRMNGHELARFENAFNGTRVRNELYSEEAQWVPQYTLEEVLRVRASALPGVAVAFQHEVRGFDQDADGVTTEVVDLRDDTVKAVRSRYLVGADGARSFVREKIGARMSGTGALAPNTSIIFRAPDMAERHALGPAIMYWMVNSDVPALLGPMDGDLWYFMATRLPDGTDVLGLDPADLVRRGTGIGNLPLEVVRSDPWTAYSLVADRYSDGRVFLAGDACHLHPPFGGFGMNMGIGDSVDLGWKLAANLQGWGGLGLLASYETERRPVHERTIDEAVANYAVLSNQFVQPALEGEGPDSDAIRQAVAERIRTTKGREFHTLGLVLGARYDGSPVIVPDGTEPPPENISTYVPSACPGGLAPHAWLADGSSLYDHFGAGMTLLATDGAPNGAAEPLEREAASRGVPLTILAPPHTSLRDRYQARFALIRPDQYVAWRGDEVPAPGPLLERVTGQN